MVRRQISGRSEAPHGEMGGFLYGITSDFEGVYACDMACSTVTKLHLAPGVPSLDPLDLTEEWVVQERCYGIALASGLGHLGRSIVRSKSPTE